MTLTFEDYLISKKIDAPTFQQAEPQLFKSWKIEFEQIHPNSFTVQKFYLINPIRRKYLLKEVVKSIPNAVTEKIITEDKTTVKADVQVASPDISMQEKSETPESKPQPSKPSRPVFKPKPKID